MPPQMQEARIIMAIEANPKIKGNEPVGPLLSFIMFPKLLYVLEWPAEFPASKLDLLFNY